MPRKCKECRDGRWECGESTQLCGAMSEAWTELGDCYIPVGIGNMVVVVTVYTQQVDGEVLVRLEKHCPKHCARHLEGELR